MTGDSGQLIVKDGWNTVNLDLVCDLIGGGTPSKSKKEYYDGNIPWATVRDMRVENLEETELSITEQAVSDSSTKIIPKGNVIIATRVGLGKVCMLKNDTAINQDLKGVIPKTDNIIPEFIFWWYKYISDEIINAGTGLTVQGVKLPFVKELQIPFITVAEQKQIVALLDQAFSAIDKAQANIETNINNAKELFQSKLNAIFSQTGEGWEERTLEEITSKIGSGSTPRGGQASYKESGISLIRSMNVHDEGFTDKKLAFIDDEQANKLKNVTIQENDVLLNITGASVARCCVVDNDYLPAKVNQHVSIIRLKENTLHYQFLHYALTSKANKDLLLGIGEQGATRQAITKVQIENFKIRFPSDIGVQKEIIKSLNIFKDNSIELESLYRAKIKNLEELKKSILQKAFQGKLTGDSEKQRCFYNYPLSTFHCSLLS